MSNTYLKTYATVYQPLLERLRLEIDSGQVPVGEMIGTEMELARREKISRVSVRRAVEVLINEGLVERRAGKGLFVRDRRIANRLAQVVVPSLAFDQCVQIVRGVQQAAQEQGIQIQVYDAHGSTEQDLRVIHGLPASAADGAVILGLDLPRFAEALYELKRKRFPFVLVDMRLSDIEIPSVLADNYGGGYAIGRRLVELGHVRIGCIVPLDFKTVQRRVAGIRDAALDAGQRWDRSLVMDLHLPPLADWSERIDQYTRQILERADRPTAIFYGNDEVAAYGSRTIRQIGLRIPQDVSVVGFDDNPLCELIDPPLATVRQPSLEMGRAALYLLQSQLGSGDVAAEHRVLPTQWIERASVAPAGGGRSN